MKGETYHFSTTTPHVALCGQRTEVHRNGHALTSQIHLVNCPRCREIMATREQVRLDQACERQRIAREEWVEVQRRREGLRVSWQ